MVILSQPQILLDIVSHLKRIRVEISEAVEGEGRGGSLKDEGTIKRELMKQFPAHILDEKARKFGDMTVLDYDGVTKHPVNIKTSGMTASDNCFSKAGIVYALTSLETSDSRLGPMNLKKMHKLIHSYKIDNPCKDYWFLCVDKNDSGSVLCRGAKQIVHWKININPSNVLQIDWKQEKGCEGIERTWDEAYEVLMGKKGAEMATLDGVMRGWPTEWLLKLKERIGELPVSDLKSS